MVKEEVPPSGPDGHCLRRNCTGQHVLAIDGFHTLSFEDRLAVVSSPLEFMSGKGEPDGLNEERLELTAESPSVSLLLAALSSTTELDPSTLDGQEKLDRRGGLELLGETGAGLELL